MEGDGIYRGPALKGLEGEPQENLSSAIVRLVETGDLNPAKFNLVLEQIRESKIQALTVVENKIEVVDDEMEEIRRNPELLHKAKLEELVEVIEDRFKKNERRHAGVEWDPICAKIRKAKKDDAMGLMFMESSLGEPDVLRYNYKNGRVMFFDFSPESPRLRRNLSYGGAVSKAKDRGVSMATPDLYMEAVGVNPMDEHSQNWLRTSGWASLLGKAKVASPKLCYEYIKEIDVRKKGECLPSRGFRSYLVF